MPLREVQKDSVTTVVDHVLELKEGTRLMVSCPLHIKDGRNLTQELQLLLQKGYTRILVDGEVMQLEDVIEKVSDIIK